MDTTAQNTAASRLIMGGMVVIALSLVAIGALLMVSQDNNDGGISARAANEIPTLDMAAVDNTINSGPMVATTPTEVSWIGMIPEAQSDFVMQSLELFGNAARGTDDPQVTIIEYGAYGCNSCRFAHNTRMIEGLFEKYPNQIRYVFIPWPVQHDNDYIATEAVLCALDQSTEAFWQMHDAIFNLTYEEYGRYNTYALYSSLAEGMALDAYQFDTCMTENEHHDYVYGLADAGFEVDLRFTPSFFVNGNVTTGYHLEQRVSEIINIK